MPSSRLIVIIIAAAIGALTWFLTKDPAVTSRAQFAYAMGAFIGAFVVGSILSGVIQGMREARLEKKRATPPGPSNTPPANR